MVTTLRRLRGPAARVRALRLPELVAAACLLALVALPAGAPPPDPTSGGPAAATPGEDPARVEAPAETPATTPPTVVEPARSFTLVATGDILLHQPLWRQAEEDARAAGEAGFDFRPLLSGVQPLVSDADLAICHLETPVAPAGGPFASYPSFSVPPDIVPALADTGYDACTTASNHIYDRGADGIDRTLDALDAAGIAHTGAARDPDEAAAIPTVSVDGARVALLSYTYGFNGIPAPGGQEWRSNPIDEGRILADAARARAEGADVVVVAMHWGDEYRHEPNAQQQDLGPALAGSADIDLLLGHHAHVVQPVEAVAGTWLVYGLGNLVANHGTPGAANEEGLLVRFTFSEGLAGWHVTRAEYAPLLMSKPGPPMRVLDVATALRDDALDPGARARLDAAWERTAEVVESLGGAEAGLTPVSAP
jgi:hypothetical protein